MGIPKGTRAVDARAQLAGVFPEAWLLSAFPADGDYKYFSSEEIDEATTVVTDAPHVHEFEERINQIQAFPINNREIKQIIIFSCLHRFLFLGKRPGIRPYIGGLILYQGLSLMKFFLLKFYWKQKLRNLFQCRKMQRE